MQNNYETFGNYILLEKLASGGMAEVYLAKKIAASGVQKFVAIKRILQQFSDSQDFIQMFKDEAKIAVNLSHSNVVSIYDFGVQNNQFYIVMEFVEGRNLRQILNRMKKGNRYFTTSQVVYITKHIAAGLDHAHRCIDPTTGQPLNIIHRDMSPQNVMLGFEGESKIVDFGIAKAETQIESTRAGTLKGKFGYMSPEQVEGQVIDSRTDIFAVGIMIWEMLANQRLFLANSEINTLRKIRECNVPSLRKINPNIPSELDHIVLKALKKDKSQRYQTAAELHRDLQGFLSRFDPDFSIQDFSSFIKSLFSEEIIEIRKKQIIYSQVTVASKHQEFAEKTELVTETHSAVIDSLSFDEMSLNTITRSKTAEQSQIIRQERVSGLDFSKATTNKQAQKERDRKLRKLRKNAKERAQAYRQNTFTNTNYNPHTLNKAQNQDATLLTVIFALSFLLGLFAYLNKFHPEFRQKMCSSLQSFGLCQSSKRGVAASEKIITINSTPQGAMVYINRKKVGKTPLDANVKSIPFDITLRGYGYKTHKAQIRKMPHNNIMNVALMRAPSGWLIVRAIGSEIYVNEVSVTSGQKIAVPANTSVNVRVVSPITGKFSETQVTVAEGETKPIVLQHPAN